MASFLKKKKACYPILYHRSAAPATHLSGWSGSCCASSTPQTRCRYRCGEIRQGDNHRHRQENLKWIKIKWPKSLNWVKNEMAQKPNLEKNEMAKKPTLVKK